MQHSSREKLHLGQARLNCTRFRAGEEGGVVALTPKESTTHISTPKGRLEALQTWAERLENGSHMENIGHLGPF